MQCTYGLDPVGQKWRDVRGSEEEMSKVDVGGQQRLDLSFRRVSTRRIVPCMIRRG